MTTQGNPSGGKLERARELLERFQPLGWLFARLSLGVMFAQTGLGKLNHLERTAGYFESLGIPAPGFQAAFVGGVEFVGGVALVVGLLTRFVSVPLAATMVVAILTALLPDVKSVAGLISLSETFYLTVLLLLIAHGPDALSLDRVIQAKFFPSKLSKNQVPQKD